MTVEEMWVRNLSKLVADFTASTGEKPHVIVAAPGVRNAVWKAGSVFGRPSAPPDGHVVLVDGVRIEADPYAPPNRAWALNEADYRRIREAA